MLGLETHESALHRHWFASATTIRLWLLHFGYFMGYATRQYARSYVGGGGTPEGLKLLLIINVAVFLLQTFGFDRFLTDWFAVFPYMVVTRLAIWQVVTYMFLHGGLIHIAFNMFALWMFGRELEMTWGKQRFLQYYFFCGIGAGICIVIVNYLFGNSGAPTIGASGAVYGILLASALMWPDREVLIYFLFPIKMKYLVGLIGLFALFGSFNLASTTSNIGHLGGLLAGFIFFRFKGARNLAGTAGSGVAGGFDPMGKATDAYKAWKLARAKKRFQVYMKKHGSDPPPPPRDPWVN